MVVKASEVSKPTVYNHYPDKAALMLATLTAWIEANKPLIAPLRSEGEFDDFARNNWLGDEAVRLYALVIGEGWRFPEAGEVFWNQFDQPWRQALTYSWNSFAANDRDIEPHLDHLLLRRLRKI